VLYVLVEFAGMEEVPAQAIAIAAATGVAATNMTSIAAQHAARLTS